MDVQWVRRVCITLPHATENVQWGDHLCFKVGGKLFAIASLEAGEYWLSLKCSPESFDELTERPGIVPAPYLARAKWVALQHRGALPQGELRELLKQAHALVYSKLPKKKRMQLAAAR